MAKMNPKSLENLKQPWQPGQTGNPNGRPTARSRLTERFIADVAGTWERHGAIILEKMAVKSPDRFADMCSRLIPRDVSLTLEHRLPGGLSEADWAIFHAIKQGIPDANDRGSTEVL